MTDELDIERLALIAAGHSAFQLLWAGVELNVFDILSKNPGLSKMQIAEKIGLEAQPTRILLTGLTALKLLVKEKDSYRNAAIVQQLLVRDSPQSLVDILGWQALIVYPGEMDFLESLRRNTNIGLGRFPGDENNLYQRLAHDPALEKVFHRAMSSLSRSANAMLAQSVDFSSTVHLTDAGGADGTNTIALARAHPHLRITVFDGPSVCQLARSNFEKAGLSERLGVHAGDLFSTPFPTGTDCILLAHMMTIWSLDKDTALLKRVYQALPRGGRVIIFNMMGNDNEDGPLTTALGSPYFLSIATGEGMLYSWREYEECLTKAGFQQTQRLALPRDHGVLVGIK
jgi:tRNA A58 N-methylase Trm61